MNTQSGLTPRTAPLGLSKTDVSTRYESMALAGSGPAAICCPGRPKDAMHPGEETGVSSSERVLGETCPSKRGCWRFGLTWKELMLRLMVQ